MEQKKQRYRRLQVRNIWLRTVFELAAIILAIVVCTTMIVSTYEDSYRAATRQNASDNAVQLARSISAVADAQSLAVDESDREYVVSRYEDILDSCFIGEDMLYSGAVYTVSGSDCTLFAASEGYYQTVSDNKLASGESYKPAKSLRASFEAAANGEEVSTSVKDVYLAFRPVSHSFGEKPYAVIVASVEYRDSMEYPSLVKSRLTLISVISAVLILVYYLVSAAISEHKKRKGEAVTTE
ncbi:MAG: hypothetical protein IJC18_00630 [Clostridia bacterium]|nr:hypothetical protein [Clostridia bacterium]